MALLPELRLVCFRRKQQDLDFWRRSNPFQPVPPLDPEGFGLDPAGPGMRLVKVVNGIVIPKPHD